jgi:hypothetical protein
MEAAGDLGVTRFMLVSSIGTHPTREAVRSL